MIWNILVYTIASVIAVSAVSLIGIITFITNTKNLDKIILYFVGFSVGALLGDVFIHLLPQAFSTYDSVLVGLFVLAGIVFSFILEKIIHWRHCHIPQGRHHHHSFALMNIVGDAIHNFIDGLIIATSYIVSIPVGLATTFAVLLHEIPHELGNFGVLVHGGFSRTKAIYYNFLTALTAILGAVIGLALSNISGMIEFLIPFAAGNLIYIAGTDLIPQLHSNTCEDSSTKASAMQLFMILLGIGIMTALLVLG